MITVYLLSGGLVALLVISFYIVRNLLLKLEAYEDVVQNQSQYIKAVGTLIKQSNERINEIDSKGVFRSDDEVGYFFNTLKEIQQNLNQFDVPENYAKKEE